MTMTIPRPSRSAGTTRSNSWTQAALLNENQTLTLSQRFERFHEANPHIYDLLVNQSRHFRDRTGAAKCGLQMLMERARWVLNVETDECDPGLNNDYGAYYARLIMAREPDLDGFFETRKSSADSWLSTYLTGAAA